MTGWIATGAYVFGYLACFRPCFRTLVRDIESPYSSLDWSDVTMCAFVALTVCSLWPLIAFGLLARRIVGAGTAEQFAVRVGGQSRDEKLVGRERAVADRERRIAELEREVGVDAVSF